VSSPLERARETAEPLASALSLPVQTDDSFLEVLFGEWEGKPIAELELDPRWRLYNTFRSGTRAPGGELASEMQSRFVAGIERLRTAHPDETIVIVSHADPIRTALAYYLGMPLDFVQRLEIRPASVSEVEVNEWGPRVLALNRTFQEPA
jgi:probable phosphoglycerate mutase